MQSNDREATNARIRTLLKRSDEHFRNSTSANGNHNGEGREIDPILREWEEIAGELETLTRSDV
jgi:hypothetical protein